MALWNGSNSAHDCHLQALRAENESLQRVVSNTTADKASLESQMSNGEEFIKVKRSLRMYTSPHANNKQGMLFVSRQAVPPSQALVLMSLVCIMS